MQEKAMAAHLVALRAIDPISVSCIDSNEESPTIVHDRLNNANVTAAL